MRVVIVEDETMVARQLKRLVSAALEDATDFSPPSGEITLIHSLEDATQYLCEHDIDLLFLDLNLSGEDGFDLLSRFTAQSFQTIVASANTDQALRSYEYGVIDFVSKPFTKERIAKALAKLRPSDLNAGSGQAGILGVRHLGKLEFISIKDIAYIKASGHYSELQLIDGRSRLHEKALKELLCVLPNNFVRIHKSYIVNLTYAQSLKTTAGSKYTLVLNEGALPVGRTYLEQLRLKII